jgi:hypothetical protein
VEIVAMCHLQGLISNDVEDAKWFKDYLCLFNYLELLERTSAQKVDFESIYLAAVSSLNEESKLSMNLTSCEEFQSVTCSLFVLSS